MVITSLGARGSLQRGQGLGITPYDVINDRFARKAIARALPG